MNISYIAFGSNLGDRQQNIAQAFQMLEQNDVHIVKQSSIIETNPINCPDESKKFLNGVIEVATNLQPHELLKTLLSIETELGRVRTIKNAARPIDLDILLYHNVFMADADLIIPHPRMKERDFVMNPLKEIAPEVAQKILNENF